MPVLGIVRVTKDVRKALICKAYSDLGECHHLEIATLRLHLGWDLGVFSDGDVNIQLYCSMTVLLEYFIA